MRILGKPELPCGHHRINAPEEGRIVRCKTCKRRWTTTFVALHPHVQEMVNDDVRRVVFVPVENSAELPVATATRSVGVKPAKRRKGRR